MPDPNQIWAQGDELSLGARQLNMWTRGAQLAHQALGGVPQDIATGPPAVLSVLLRNDHDDPLLAYALTRWSGEPLTPAEIGASLPMLVLRTSTVDIDPIGVTSQHIAVDGIGLLHTLGVCWARCRGEIAAGDSLAPDEEFYGVLSEAATNVTALADVPMYEDAIIPVLIGSPGEAVCEAAWYFSAEGLPAGGTSTWEVTVNGVTEEVEFPCPCTIAQTRAALATHSEIVPGDVTIAGGTLPHTSQKVTFRRNPTEITLAENLLDRSWTAPPAYYWDPT